METDSCGGSRAAACAGDDPERERLRRLCGNAPFEDVSMFSWYYSDVKNAHEQGLVDGVTPTRFSPTGTLTIAQAIKLAAALHQKAQTGAVTLKNGSPWYSTYVSYAVANGIIEPEYASYKPALMNSPISRAEFVHIFYDAMPSGSYAARNTVQDNAIPTSRPRISMRMRSIRSIAPAS